MRAQRYSHLVTFPRLRVNQLMNGVYAAGNLSINNLEVLIQSRSMMASKVRLQPRLMTASKCISKLTRSQSRSASLFSLDQVLQVYLQTSSITACKCISKLASLRTSSLHHHRLEVHFQTHSMAVSKCISNYACLPPPSASLKSLDHGLGVCL